MAAAAKASQTAPSWIAHGMRFLGLKEVPGAASNPTIVKWARDAGIDWYKSDADAWCAVFVGGVLAACSLPTTKSALARSYLAYGTRLDPTAPVVGAVVVFPRGSNPGLGHVGFVAEVGATTLKVLNGNVGDEVRLSTFTRASVIGLAWPPGVALPAGARPLGASADGVLRDGATGAAVLALQKSLNTLGYAIPETSRFEARTADAVRRFQDKRGMLVDGEVGPATKAALDAAVAARASSAKPLPKGGALASGTVKGAVGSIAAGAAGLAEALSTRAVEEAVGAAKEIDAVVRDGQSHLTGGLFGAAVCAIAIAGGLYLLWRRYRDAGRLPRWLGGGRPDDVPEAARPTLLPPNPVAAGEGA